MFEDGQILEDFETLTTVVDALKAAPSFLVKGTLTE
jgi:hypothetical protein